MTFPVNFISGVRGARVGAFAEDPEVMSEVRSALLMRGYDGPNALSAFRRDQGLMPTSEIDPETLDALGVELR